MTDRPTTMTDRPTTLTARTIGETENALQAILRKSLDGSGLQYHDWVALKLISETEPAITRRAALDEMIRGLKVDETTAGNELASELHEIDLDERGLDRAVEIGPLLLNPGDWFEIQAYTNGRVNDLEGCLQLAG